MEDILDQSNQFNENEDYNLEPIEDRLMHLPSFEFGKYFTDSGNMFTKMLGPVIGFIFLSLVVMLMVFGLLFAFSNVLLASSTVVMVTSYVLVMVLFMVLLMPLYMGPYIFAGKLLKSGEANFSYFFKGVKKTKRLILTVLITFLLTGLPMMILSGAFSVANVSNLSYMISSMQAGDINGIMQANQSGGLLSNLLSIFVTIITLNVYLFVIYRKVSPMEALKYSVKLGLKKFFPYLGLILVLGLINIVGFIFLGIGLLFTIPLSLGVLVAAFDHMIGIDEREITFE